MSFIDFLLIPGFIISIALSIILVWINLPGTFVYFFLISQHVSIITLIPIILIIIMVFSVFTLSRRENITEFSHSLENINDIIYIK